MIARDAANEIGLYFHYSRKAEEEEKVLSGMPSTWTYSRWATKIRLTKYRFAAQSHLDRYNQIIIHSRYTDCI